MGLTGFEKARYEELTYLIDRLKNTNAGFDFKIQGTNYIIYQPEMFGVRWIFACKGNEYFPYDDNFEYLIKQVVHYSQLDDDYLIGCKWNGDIYLNSEDWFFFKLSCYFLRKVCINGTKDMCDLLRKGLNMHLKEILQSDDFEEDVKHIAEKIPLTEEWFNIAKKYYLNNTVLSPFDFIDLKENWNCHLDEFVLSAINNKPQRVCSTTKRDFRNGVSGYLITNCVDGMVKYNIVKAIQKRFKRVKKSEVNSLSIIDVYRDIKNEEFETVDKSWIAKWISDNCKQVNLKKVRG